MSDAEEPLKPGDWKKPRKPDDDTVSYVLSLAGAIETSSDPSQLRLLINNSLRELKSQEASIATHKRCSSVVEQLLQRCSAPAACGFVERCLPYMEFLTHNRYGSHVLETALGRLVDAAHGATAEEEGEATEDEVEEDEDEANRTPEQVLLAVAESALPLLPELVFDTSGTHVIRGVFRGLCGYPRAAGEGPEAAAAGGKRGKASAAAADKQTEQGVVPPRSVPTAGMVAMAIRWCESIVTGARAGSAAHGGGDDDGDDKAVAPMLGDSDETVFNAATNQHAGPALQTMAQALAGLARATAKVERRQRRRAKRGEEAGGAVPVSSAALLGLLDALCSRIVGLPEEGFVDDEDAEAAAAAGPAGWLLDLVEDPIGSHMVECVISLVTDDLFGRLLREGWFRPVSGRVGMVDKRCAGNQPPGLRAAALRASGVDDDKLLAAASKPAWYAEMQDDRPELVVFAALHAHGQYAVQQLIASCRTGPQMVDVLDRVLTVAGQLGRNRRGVLEQAVRACALAEEPVQVACAQALQHAMLADASPASAADDLDRCVPASRFALWLLGYQPGGISGRSRAAAAAAEAGAGAGDSAERDDGAPAAPYNRNRAHNRRKKEKRRKGASTRGVQVDGVASPHGAQLAAAVLQLGGQGRKPLLDALLAVHPDDMALLACDPWASRHLLEPIFKGAVPGSDQAAPSGKPKFAGYAQKLMLRFRKHWLRLATDRFGCWVVQRAFDAANSTHRRAAILGEMAEASRQVVGDRFGRHVAKHTRLEFFVANRKSWTTAMNEEIAEASGAQRAGLRAIQRDMAAAGGADEADKRLLGRSKKQGAAVAPSLAPIAKSGRRERPATGQEGSKKRARPPPVEAPASTASPSAGASTAPADDGLDDFLADLGFGAAARAAHRAGSGGLHAAKRSRTEGKAEKKEKKKAKKKKEKKQKKGV